jgi:hypothetical protein
MVVEVIDQDNIVTFELEDNSPVAAHIHSPKAGILAFQLMQPEPRKIQISRLRSDIQPCQDKPQSVGMLCLYSGLVACFEEVLQALVPEAYDHTTNIKCNPMGCKRKSAIMGLLGRPGDLSR